MARLIEVTKCGLFCEAGGFYIDPWRRVERAVITHAHSDHARSGSRRFLAAACGVGLLRARLGLSASIDAIEYGASLDINGVRVSLHPAGHILGSAQVRVEHRGEVWVVSGDYKTQGDPTCAAFEPLRCHTFVTESTFALPVYRWPSPDTVMDDVNAWWRENQRDKRTSIIFAYALGKAQRLLAALDTSIGPVIVHGAVAKALPAYEEAGVRLPRAYRAEPHFVTLHRGRALVIAPPSTRGSRWLRKFGDASTAFASGWMLIGAARRRMAVNRGFVLSDHADWEGLLSAIRATGAESIGATHGYNNVLVRYLRESGLDAWPIATRFDDAEDESADARFYDTESGGEETTSGASPAQASLREQVPE